MRAFILFVIGAVVIASCVVVLLAWDGVLTGRTNPETDDAYIEGDYTPIAAHIQAYVRRVAVENDRSVKAGDLVVELVDDDYRARVDQTNAQVAEAEAALTAADARIGAARAQLVQAQTRVAATSAVLTRDSLEDRRQHNLLPTDAGLLSAVQDADAQRRRSSAEIDQARAAVAESARQIDLLSAQRQSAAANLAVAQAQLALARIQLGYTRIIAPRDGVVGPRQVREGTLVQPGTVVITLTPLDTVWVIANFSERQLAQVEPGQHARVRVDAFPGSDISGQVVGLSPATGAQLSGVPADNTTGNYTRVIQRVGVKVALELADSKLRGLLLPGMSTQTRVITDAAHPDQAPREAR